MKTRYIQLKESPEYKAGAIWEKNENDSDQFICINHREFCKFTSSYGDANWSHRTLIVTDQPDWFEEVFPVFVNKKQKDKIDKILSD